MLEDVIQLKNGFICFYPPPSLWDESERVTGVWVYPDCGIKDFGTSIPVTFYLSDGCIVHNLVKDGWIDTHDEFTQRRVRRLLMKAGVY